MTNGDFIRSMSDEKLASFINIERPNCNEICKDAKAGCAWECKYHGDKDVILEWLKREEW